MRLLADENIPDELVDLLRDKGYDVATVPPKSKDADIALIAKRERRILLTQDKDFANIIWYPPETLHGIIRLKFHPPIMADILAALEDLFQRFSPKNLDKRLVVLEKDGLRIR